jgi:hypothetical protein
MPAYKSYRKDMLDLQGFLSRICKDFLELFTTETQRTQRILKSFGFIEVSDSSGNA